MRSRLVVLVLFCGSLIMAPSCAVAAAQPQQELLAQQSQKNWLQLCDTGKYAESQQESGAYFHAHTTKAQWVKTLTTNRAPLGKVISRTLTSARFTKTLPGTPDGQYVVITYNTHFTQKQAAVETVTSSLEMDGDWKVAGYFIR